MQAGWESLSCAQAVFVFVFVGRGVAMQVCLWLIHSGAMQRIVEIVELASDRRAAAAVPSQALESPLAKTNILSNACVFYALYPGLNRAAQQAS